MGSCLGTNSAPKAPNSAHHNSGGSKSPPPVVYEESVKEVLSVSAVPEHRLLPIPRFHGMLLQTAAADDYEIHGERENAAALLPLPRRDRRMFPGEVRRENAAGRSPARRLDTSPGRVKPGPRPRPRPGISRNTAGGGERLVRRSRSPVTASDSGSSKTGNYPGRMEIGSADRIRKGKEAAAPTSNELLESSLVSLECFIFL